MSNEVPPSLELVSVGKKRPWHDMLLATMAADSDGDLTEEGRKIMGGIVETANQVLSRYAITMDQLKQLLLYDNEFNDGNVSLMIVGHHACSPAAGYTAADQKALRMFFNTPDMNEQDLMKIVKVMFPVVQKFTKDHFYATEHEDIKAKLKWLAVVSVLKSDKDKRNCCQSHFQHWFGR